MKKPTKQMLKAALFEASFVVLGVILALSANEWRNDLAEQKSTQRALTSIYAELAENKILVEQSNAYHSKTSRILYSSGEKPDIKLFDKGFVLPARVSSNAWHTASETGALKTANFDTVLQLSKLYAAQMRYENQTQTIGNIIYTRLFEGGSDAILDNYKNLATVISTMQFRENQLLNLYNDVLDQQQSSQQ